MIPDGGKQGWIKSGLYNGLQKISIPMFGILSTALLAHKALTKPEMGVWANFLMLTSFIEMFRAGIVRNSLIKYINFSEKDSHLKIMSSAFLLNVALTILISVVLLFTSGHIESLLKSPGLGAVLDIYAFTLIILIFFSHFEWLTYAHIDFKTLFLAYFVRQGTTFLGILIYFLIVGKTSLTGLAFIYTGGVLLGTITAFVYLRYLFKVKFIFSSYWIKELWNFGKYVFGSNISTLIFRNADQLLLSNISANPAIVASQNIARRVINITDIPSQVAGDFLFPKNSRPELSAHREKTKYYYEKAVGSSLSIILPTLIILLVFPKILILIIAGREYLDGVPYLRLIAITIFTQAYLKQFGMIMDSSGYPNVNFWVVSVIAVMMIGFCFLFIPEYHLMGAAYALVATHILGFAVSMFILYKYFKISIFNTIKYCIDFYPEIVRIFMSIILYRKKR